MNNTDIIYNEAIRAGIYTKAEADAIMLTRGALPIHTFQEWKNAGYSVKKGEHAAIRCDLWKYTSKPSKKDREKAAGMTEEEAAAKFGHYYMAAAYLFTHEQVKRQGEPDGASAAPSAGQEFLACTADQEPAADDAGDNFDDVDPAAIRARLKEYEEHGSAFVDQVMRDAERIAAAEAVAEELAENAAGDPYAEFLDGDGQLVIPF